MDLYPRCEVIKKTTARPTPGLAGENNMHISEGVLGGPVLAAGVALSLIGLAVGLKKMDYDRLPQTAILAAAFFVASLVSLPVGPAKAHLVLNGLLGLLLGWGVFPALFVALALQALLFQFGGLTTLGVNTFNMALPALLCYLALRRLVVLAHMPVMVVEGVITAAIEGFLCGFLSVGGSALLVAGTLVTSGEEFLAMARLVVLAHIPVMVVEGVITAAMVGFLRRVRPAMLDMA
ncbi:cobalt/nickel transport system permease protein [Desulfarculales bacterium]